MENKFPRRSNWKYEKSDSFGPFGKSFMDSLFHVSRPIDLVPIRANPSKDSQNYRLIGHKSIYMPIHRWSIIDPSGDICRRTDNTWFTMTSGSSLPFKDHGTGEYTVHEPWNCTGNCSSLIKCHRFVDWPRMKAIHESIVQLTNIFFFFKRLMRSFMDVESLLD